MFAPLTFGLWNKKHPTFMQMGTFCTHTFYTIFATFLLVQLTDSTEVETVLLFRIFQFSFN
jgi:lipoate synthase